jgi:hypothetical protein
LPLNAGGGCIGKPWYESSDYKECVNNDTSTYTYKTTTTITTTTNNNQRTGMTLAGGGGAPYVSCVS